MITTMLSLFLLEMVNWFMAFLPEATIPAGVTGVLNLMQQGVGLVWLILPMNTIFIALGLALTTEGIIQGFYLSVFIYNKLRGSG